MRGMVVTGRMLNEQACIHKTINSGKSKNRVYSINEEDLKQGGKKKGGFQQRQKQSWVYPQDMLFGLTF